MKRGTIRMQDCSRQVDKAEWAWGTSGRATVGVCGACWGRCCQKVGKCQHQAQFLAEILRFIDFLPEASASVIYATLI